VLLTVRLDVLERVNAVRHEVVLVELAEVLHEDRVRSDALREGRDDFRERRRTSWNEHSSTLPGSCS